MTTIRMTHDRGHTVARPIRSAMVRQWQSSRRAGGQNRALRIYVMNKMDFYLSDDPREKRLRDAAYRAIARLGAGASVFPPTGERVETTLA